MIKEIEWPTGLVSLRKSYLNFQSFTIKKLKSSLDDKWPKLGQSLDKIFFVKWAPKPTLNPLNPHDASKHHFESLNKDAILEQKLSCNCFNNIFSSHLHPLHVDSNSRRVVDEDYNGKFRLEEVKVPSIAVSRLFDLSFQSKNWRRDEHVLSQIIDI